MRIISKPILSNYYLTYRCNAECNFCDIWEKPSPYVTVEDATKNFEDLKRLGVKIIDFTGGEPLLHREIGNLLTIAKKMGFITTLTTNGLLYPKNAHKLAGLVDMLHFSLDSADKETHDKMRGVQCFDKVMESIKIAKELGERPDILFTVFDSNVDEIEAVYNQIVVPNKLVLILNPSFQYNNVGEPLSENSLGKLSKWGRKKSVYLNDAFIELRRNGGNDINDPVCKAASSTIVISPENKLILPCFHLDKSEVPIENNLFELWNSPLVKEARDMEGKYKECAGCTINCYMQPSFGIEMNKYFWMAIRSTLKYNRMKGTWKELV